MYQLVQSGAISISRATMQMECPCRLKKSHAGTVQCCNMLNKLNFRLFPQFYIEIGLLYSVVSPPELILEREIQQHITEQGNIIGLNLLKVYELKLNAAGWKCVPNEWK